MWVFDFFFVTLLFFRIVIAFFAISGLDILNHIDTLTDEYKNNIINWIYRLQTVDDEGNTNKFYDETILIFLFPDLVCGFQGSSFVNTIDNRGKRGQYKWGHLASTYSALCSLLALGDDLSRVNRSGIIKSKLQKDHEYCL